MLSQTGWFELTALPIFGGRVRGRLWTRRLIGRRLIVTATLHVIVRRHSIAGDNVPEHGTVRALRRLQLWWLSHGVIRRVLVDVVIVVVISRSVVVNTVDESGVGISRANFVVDAVGLLRSVDDIDALRNSLERYLDLE